MNKGAIRIGTILFKYRSFLPLPLMVLIVIFFPAAGTAFVSQAILGLIVALCGEALRCLSVGYAAAGTSGRESYLRAEELNTEGLYSMVRNPLYIANLVIYGGLLLAYGNPLALLLGLGLLAAAYGPIVAAEERFLQELYGALYLNYCRRVRRWLPRIKDFTPAPGKFAWKRILWKENDSIFNLLVIYLLIVLYREKLAFGRIVHGTVFIVAGGLLCALYLAVKVVKAKRRRSDRIR